MLKRAKTTSRLWSIGSWRVVDLNWSAFASIIAAECFSFLADSSCTPGGDCCLYGAIGTKHHLLAVHSIQDKLTLLTAAEGMSLS